MSWCRMSTERPLPARARCSFSPASSTSVSLQPVTLAIISPPAIPNHFNLAPCNQRPQPSVCSLQGCKLVSIRDDKQYLSNALLLLIPSRGALSCGRHCQEITHH